MPPKRTSAQAQLSDGSSTDEEAPKQAMKRVHVHERPENRGKSNEEILGELIY
jgi:hypothetical protein